MTKTIKLSKQRTRWTFTLHMCFTEDIVSAEAIKTALMNEILTGRVVYFCCGYDYDGHLHGYFKFKRTERYGWILRNISNRAIYDYLGYKDDLFLHEYKYLNKFVEYGVIPSRK